MDSANRVPGGEPLGLVDRWSDVLRRVSRQKGGRELRGSRTGRYASRLSIALTLVLVLIGGVLLATVRESEAIPAWSRKFNADCSMCHLPSGPPRLNTFGLQYRRAGYRTPTEFNKDQDVTKVGDFLSVRVRTQFAYENQQGETEGTETRADATLFYAGAATRNLSANFHNDWMNDGSTLLNAQVQGVLGNADRYLSIRAGQMHPIQEVGLGGWDRPTGINPTPLHASLLTSEGANFTFDQRQKAIELAYVQGPGRLMAQVLNGVNQDGSMTGSTAGIEPQKDYFVAYEHILDDLWSGFTAFYYNGTTHGMASPGMVGQPVAFSRVGVNANKVFPVEGIGFFELQGGYIHSHDNVPADIGPDKTGDAFYVESQQVLMGPELAFIERFSFIDQDVVRHNAIRKLYTVGAVTRVQTWGRLAAEYTYTDNRDNQVNGPTGHSAVLEFFLAW